MDTGPKIIETNGNIIIDPNPENHVVNHEDLYIYASLVAKTRGRSFLTEDPNDDLELENVNVSTVDMVISDTATYQDEKRQFLTTAWTNIGGSQTQDVNRSGDLEGFGITNVDVEIKGSYIPRVVIDFVDIRGATLFEQGSCSPYSLFFHLPYPVFELTLKGYYGKPVTYFLNLQKFNTKFNSETGNFECKAEFIGWSYAFLADMLMGYIRCSNYMTGQWGAREKLRQKYDETVKYYHANGIYDDDDYVEGVNAVYVEGSPSLLQPFCKRVSGNVVECKTISNLMLDITKIEDFLARAKGDDDYQEVTNLIRLRNEIVGMKDDISRFARKLEQDFEGTHTKRLTQARNPDGSERTIQELYVFTQAPSDDLLQLMVDFWKRPVKDNDKSGFGEISQTVPIAKELPIISRNNSSRCGGHYIDVASQMTFNNGLTGCDDVQQDDSELRFMTLDYLDDTRQFQNGMMNFPDEGLVYNDVTNTQTDISFYIDLGILNTKLDENIGKLDALIDTKRNVIKEEIDAGIIKILGFRPTIRNVFTILTCNTENFMQLLLDVSILAEEHHNNPITRTDYNGKFADGNQRLMALKNKGDEEREIYPWPTYYERQYKSTATYNSSSKTETKEVYPGKNSSFNTWPEVKFVEDFIDACQKLNEADEDLNPDKDNMPGFDNRFPINPLESLVYGKIQLKYRDKLKSLTDDNDAIDVTRGLIAERMFITSDFSYFNKHRLTTVNSGLGFSFNYENSINPISNLERKTTEQEPQWISLRTEAYDSDESDFKQNVVSCIAAHDAHNLLSCITDPDLVSRIQTNIANGGDLKTQLKTWLKGQTDNRTSKVDDEKSWFNDNILPNQPDTWAYYPQKGYIGLVGSGSEGSLGEEESYDQIQIHADITKMQTKYLFQLLSETEFNNRVDDTGITLNYVEGADGDSTDKIFQRRKKLDELVMQSTKYNALLGLQATETETSGGYAKLEESTKLILFDGSEKDGKRLFTTLGIASEQNEAYKGFDNVIQYACTPITMSSDESDRSSRFMAGYNGIKQAIIPLAGQMYMWQGAYDRQSKPETDTISAFPWRNEIGNTTNAVGPMYPISMELAGRGIYTNVEIKSNNSDETSSQGEQPLSYDTANDRTPAKYSLNGSFINAYAWAGTLTFDTLIQTPIWLDNVNRFRKAQTFNNSFTNLSVSRSRGYSGSKSDPGYLRPRVSETNAGNPGYISLNTDTNKVKGYTLKSPDLRITDPSNSRIETGKYGYDTHQIEARNLAYLFLASCKPTPFITCGLSEKRSGEGSLSWDSTGDGVFNYKHDIYPKALVPFIKSNGTIKIPKVWVYGMGAVLWRWKMYMGCNTDDNGNIRWRNPLFGEKPEGYDPLSQPGHPAIANETAANNPLTGNLNASLGTNVGREYRSRTDDTNDSTIYSFAGESFTNSLFSSLWGGAIENKKVTQGSVFFRGVTRTDAIIRCTSGVGGPASDRIGKNRAPQQMAPLGVWNGNANSPCWGHFFDYWGVYANDTKLSEALPHSWEPNPGHYLTVDYTYPWPDYTNPDTSIGGWAQFGAWYATEDAPSGSFVNTAGSGPLGLLVESNYADLNQYSYEFFGNPLQMQYRSAREAVANSFWPFLWIAPWQHFYTEPVNSKGKTGILNQRVDNTTTTEGNFFVEQTLAFIPYDLPFRDYVGNFGKLGDETANYSSSKLDLTIKTRTLPIPNEFIMKTVLREMGNNSIEPPQGDSVGFKINVAAKDGSFADNLITGKGNVYALYNTEGGKYAELIALLPNFVKESFVEEFDEWCENGWKKEYLEVVDPVNFKDNGTWNKKKDNKKKLNQLAGSYRFNQFIGNGNPLSGLLGKEVAHELFTTWQGSVGARAIDNTFAGIPSLNATEDKVPFKNQKKIKQLQKELFDEYFYAIIPTPRIFALDVFSNDPLNPSYNEKTRSLEPASMPTTWNKGDYVSFLANDKFITTYTEAFQKELKNYTIEKRESLTVDSLDDDISVLNDDDIKLSLYRSFKSICDKWISSTRQKKSNTPSFFFNITKQDTISEVTGSADVPLAGHFTYVNRVMGEIGNKAVLDIVNMKKIVDNPKMSLYNLISDLLGENKFDFFPLPSFSNFTSDKSDEKLKEMFTPDTNSITKASGPNFICLYVGGSSRTVDLKPKPGCDKDKVDMGYQNDGFSLSEETEEKPFEFQDPEEPLKVDTSSRYYAKGRIEGKGYTAFRVAYGIENQNMFKSVELDQAEFSETNESLLVIDRLANGGNPADRTVKGNNLHNLYLTRSYTCTVESLGNMMIQPLQYFELTNIPMFYGTYLITEVKHNVKPHYIGTTFKGVRQPIMTVPVVEDVATAMAMTLRDIKAKKSSGDPLRGGGGGGGNSSPVYISGQKVTVDGLEYIDFGANDSSEYLNHRWNGKPTTSTGPTPNFKRKVETIVMHWSAGYTLKGALSTLQTRGVHYHLMAAEDGTLCQVSDLSKVAWHAGNACGDGARGHGELNYNSIGINYVGGVEGGWGSTNSKGGCSPRAYVRTPEQWNQDTLTVPFCPNGQKRVDGYMVCVESAGDKGCGKQGHGKTFSPKKQFGALIKACILAKKAHPGIKRITSHHWVTTRKTDNGDKFPWGELLIALKQQDPSGGWENVEIWSKVANTCGGGGYVRKESDQNVDMSDVDIDLDMSGGALDVEYAGNKGTSPGNGVTGTRSDTKGTKPGSGVQEALKYAGKI